MDKAIHLLICASVFAAASAHAAEGGGSVYPNGAENFVAGALPPPGLYGIAFVNHYEANRLNDFSGKQIGIPGFKIRATAITPRVIWVPGVSVLGGDLVAVAPGAVAQADDVAFAIVGDDAHRLELMETEFKGRGKIEISRFKGLGEMLPAQLKETTMDPSRRTLLRVAIDTEDFA